VTVLGVAVWAVELSVPPPEIIDQAAVIAEPPMVAPVNGAGEGIAPAQSVKVLPAFTVGDSKIEISTVSEVKHATLEMRHTKRYVPVIKPVADEIGEFGFINVIVDGPEN
jgi:hypothetical protein